ncbi:MAG: hypothetical protein ACPIOQ_25360 [Promethearchaeia archaeon]
MKTSFASASLAAAYQSRAVMKMMWTTFACLSFDCREGDGWLAMATCYSRAPVGPVLGSLVIQKISELEFWAQVQGNGALSS